jgi:hypothetical protein
MKKTILSLVTAAAVGTAGLTAVSQPAHAVWWVVPAIVGGAVVGVGVGAAADNAAHQQYAYEPRGSVYVQPTADCHIVRERIDGQWRRMRVCD